MNNEEQLNDIQKRLQALETTKHNKEIQQISLPLDEPSVRIIKDTQPTATTPDYTGLVRFGGDGTDGALSISSGTTTLDIGGVAVFVKNYSSISITGTGALAFSNPHGNGTLIVLKSQGDVTITSSANPTVDLRSLGAVGGGSASANNGVTGNSGISSVGSILGGTLGGTAGAAPVGGGVGGIRPLNTDSIVGYFKIVLFGCGGGGGSGGACTGTSTSAAGGGGGASQVTSGTAAGNSSGVRNNNGTSGSGGRGGGALLIECGGAYSASGVFNAAGQVGGNATGTGCNGGGGGGGGGTIVVAYVTLTSNTATYTVTGGAGGTQTSGVSSDGGAGAAGTSLVTPYKA